MLKIICERASSSTNNSVFVDNFETSVNTVQEMSEESDERLVMETVRGKKFEIEYSGGNTFNMS